MHKKIFTQELEGTRRRGRPKKGWKEEVEEIFKCWEWEDGESWWLIGKNGRTLFDRPKPTVGCSANGRRRLMSLSTMWSILEALLWKHIGAFFVLLRYIGRCQLNETLNLGTHVKAGYVCPILTRCGVSWKIFQKSPQYEIGRKFVQW